MEGSRNRVIGPTEKPQFKNSCFPETPQGSRNVMKNHFLPWLVQNETFKVNQKTHPIFGQMSYRRFRYLPPEVCFFASKVAHELLKVATHPNEDPEAS